MDPRALIGRFRGHRNTVQGIVDQIFPHHREDPERILPQLDRLVETLRSELDHLHLLVKPTLWPTDLAVLAREVAERLATAFALPEPLELNLQPGVTHVLTDRERVVALVERLVTLTGRSLGQPLRISTMERKGRPWLVVSTMPLGAGVLGFQAARGATPPIPITREDVVTALGLCQVETALPGGRLELAFTPAPDTPPEAIRFEPAILALESSLEKLSDAIAELEQTRLWIHGLADPASRKESLDKARRALDNAGDDLDGAASAMEQGPQDIPRLLSLDDLLREAVAGQKNRLRQAHVRCALDIEPRLPQAWMDRTRAESLFASILTRALAQLGAPGEIRISIRANPQEAQFLIEALEVGQGEAGGRTLVATTIEDVIAKGLRDILPNYMALAAPVQEMLRLFKCQLLSGEENDLGMLNLALEQQILVLLDRAGFPAAVAEPARHLPWLPGQLYKLDPDFEAEIARAWDHFPIQVLEPLCARLARGEPLRLGFAEAALVLWVFGREWSFQDWRGANALALVGIDDVGLTALGSTLTRLAREADPVNYAQRLILRALGHLANVTTADSQDGPCNDRLASRRSAR